MSADASQTIQALGRPSYLGQLYDARSSKFIHGFRLFNDTSAEKIETKVSKTDFKYDFVKTIKEKANLLNVKASLSVSILGGMIDVSGMGSYLKSENSNGESTTLAFVGQFRTNSKSLDLNKLASSETMDQAKVQACGATHVVTAITYGGNVIASLTQNNSLSSSKQEIEGDFKLSIMKGLGKAFSAEGSAKLTSEEKEKIDQANLEVKLVADFELKDEEIPTTPFDLIAIFKKSSKLVGEGVPCEVELTPLTWFQGGLPTFRELAEADLMELTDLYDTIMLLGQDRTALLGEAETHKDIFSTFYSSCRQSKLRVAKLVQEARQDLFTFLQKARSTNSGEVNAGAFRDGISARFADEQKMFQKDRNEWRMKMEQLRTAKQYNFPPVSFEDLREKMRLHSSSGAVAVILIPETVQTARLLSTYVDVADDIQKWRSSIDKDHSNNATSKTEYISIYADKALDEALLSLDDTSKSLTLALETARSDCAPAFLTYGKSNGENKWSMLNQDGWGVLINRAEGWRYIGGVRKGLRHGHGVITYADGSEYRGTWVAGKREGRGVLFPPTSQRTGQQISGTEGVFVDGVLVADGVVVQVTVYDGKGGEVKQSGEVALRKGNSTLAHVGKIGQVLGWQLGKRQRLVLPSGFQVRVNGPLIDASEDPTVASKFWTLDAPSDLRVAAYPS